jgi:alkanesulfonate monooxygenase SsuD/methylene tetrahydromethanopterin reductase-like flavin-dependent oxidoreductase (luciferase family)
MPLSKSGVVFGGHRHSWPDLLELTRAAEDLGAEVVLIDGDTSFRPSRPDASVLHSWSATLALLARTRRVSVGSMRIVSHWNTTQLAAAIATAEAIAPGRLRFLISIGGQGADRRVGLHPDLGAGDRTRWLDEMLDALPALWRGEPVERRGRFVSLEAHLAPLENAPPVEIGGRGPLLLDLVARRADRWDINLPPVPRLIEAADATLASACNAVGRDPDEIGRSMWITLRVDRELDDDLCREYRRINPWFPMLRDDELEIRTTLRVDLPLLDLSGLALEESLRTLDRLA